jgi:hypothetical protein
MRLLVLHKTSLFPDELLPDIFCDLIDVHLDYAPPFEAISYTWGDPTMNHEVIVAGSRLSVPANTYNALLSQRSTYEKRVVWIDSICINQQDDVEKTGQVLLMRDIYHQASPVTLWLGNVKDADLAVQLLEELSVVTQSLSDEDVFKRYQSECMSPRWPAFNKLLWQPWFERTWVVQEVAVASAIELIYGSKTFSWDLLVNGSNSITNPSSMCHFLFRTENPNILRGYPNALGNMSAMTQFREQCLGERPMSLLQSLNFTCSFKAMDAKDKIFALYGISKDRSPWLTPDYTREVRQVYGDTTRYLLNKHPSEAIASLSLAGKGYHSKLEGLPSWAFDWSRTIDINDAVPFPGGHFIYLPVFQTFMYRESGRSEPINYSPQNRDILHLGGTYVDSIAHTGSKLRIAVDGQSNIDISGDGPMKWAQWTKEAWELAKTHALSPYRVRQTTQPLFEVFWRTLIGGRSLDLRTKPAAPSYESYFK